MATDYILFVHGVNTRPPEELSTHITRPNPQQSFFANDLIKLISDYNRDKKLSLNLKMRELHWYEIMLSAEKQLLNWFEQSKVWANFWFKDFRKQYILPFAGDAALYISRYIGSDVVETLKNQAKAILQGCNPEKDRLHLVTHSWGTVILFDVLFAGRWDDPNIPGCESVQEIRNLLFGISPEPQKGIRIASIHTLGSPIAIANLINVRRIQRQPAQKLTKKQIETIFTHDITLRFEQLLQNLYAVNSNTKLPWRNFVHPGDPLAYPLSVVIPKLLDKGEEYLDIQDVIINDNGALEWLAKPFSNTFLALINGGSAHGSYWKNQTVAEMIAKTIQQSAILN